MSKIEYICKSTIENRVGSDFPLLSPSGQIKFPNIEIIKDHMNVISDGLISSVDLSQALLHRISTVLFK